MRAIECGLRFFMRCGINHVFGIPAGSINALYDALIDLPQIKPIIAKHETTAGYIATAYTRITGVPSICVGSSGPGATNLISAAANAWRLKVPVIFITGSVPCQVIGRGGAQELGSVPIFSSITKLSTIVTDANRLPEVFAEAYHTAMSGTPGPVHLEIPIDVQMTEIGYPDMPPVPFVDTVVPDAAAVRRAADTIIQTGTRGAILLGHGAKSARKAVHEFAELVNWPVATTPRGKGAFPENHPLALGVYGLAANAPAVEYLNSNRYDVLLVVGSSLGEAATSNWEPTLVHNKKLIQIDLDAGEFNKNYKVDIALCGEATVTLEHMLSCLQEEREAFRVTEEYRQASDRLLASKQRQPLSVGEEGWNTKMALQQLGACAPDTTRFYIDIGEFMTYSIQNLCIGTGQAFDIDTGFGAMGTGIGGAIGAQLAEPERPIICVTGDGCFFMHGMDIVTAKEYNLPILFVVINNARLGMVYHGHMMQYGRCLGEFSPSRVDVSAVAKSLGLASYQVHSLADLQPALIEQWLASGKPALVEVVVQGNEIPPMGDRVKFLEGATY